MKIACIQINSGNDMAANIARAQTLVAQAAGAGAQFVGLPENVFLMEAPGGKRTLYNEENHPGVAASAQMARAYHIWLLAGSVAVLPAEGGDKSYNRALLFNPNGDIAARYDKIHLFDVELPNGETYAESARFLPGHSMVNAQLPGAALGLTICYDVRFPRLYRQLAKAGAEIIAVPAAFTQTTGEAHWHTLLRARAIENGCFVIAPAQTGTHPGGRKTYGHALIVDPWGKILADAGTDEGFILADIDIEEAKRVRARLPSLSHDREFV